MISEEAGGVGTGDCGFRVVISVALGCSRIIDDQTAERKITFRSRLGLSVNFTSRLSGRGRSWNFSALSNTEVAAEFPRCTPISHKYAIHYVCACVFALLTQLIGIALIWIECLQLRIGECLQFLVAIAEQVVLALVHWQAAAHC